MATSEKRVAANRQNAKKSTGPRTLDGKERARLNAVTHGLTAQTAVLPGEDPSELEALGKSLMRQLKPRGVVQRIVAERVVSLAWKLRRVARAEEQIAAEMRSRPGENRYCKLHSRCDGAVLLAESIRPDDERRLFEGCDSRLTRLTEYELKLDGALRASVRELLRLQKEADAFEDGEEEPEVVDEAPTPVEAPAPPVEENEPRAVEEGHTVVEEENLGPPQAVPPDDGEAPPDRTNPIAGADGAAQGQDRPEVTPDFAPESSAPAPGTSASPRPGPRR